ncbi:MAG: hypothetical protein GW762_04815 [Candidatus Pacebacteria bacterium]|nr:hypothetical protein [Candidatus Paceibacterota bacterium]PIR63257.1 MAG: hypothetical protein COU64_05520 [Candidatus Pacebacteria bacterium CG10_big_fil_rev_8_21_14_0_10_40_26]PIZ78313.1 MAG: hypothetical protein COY01_06045 [Candidatus Pacebacteria bacterium CG_4_10_14_0_2_um_filter_40_20]PJA68643.1 MAG: hypothetical protein CO156_04000 [Candidatus Pacebacteria bacterium CG_4_9_14_3_um_filter_40_12]
MKMKHLFLLVVVIFIMAGCQAADAFEASATAIASTPQPTTTTFPPTTTPVVPVWSEPIEVGRGQVVSLTYLKGNGETVAIKLDDHLRPGEQLNCFPLDVAHNMPGYIQTPERCQTEPAVHFLKFTTNVNAQAPSEIPVKIEILAGLNSMKVSFDTNQWSLLSVSPE